MKTTASIMFILLLCVINVNFSQSMPNMGIGFMHGHGGYASDADKVAKGGRGYDKFWIEYVVDIPKRMHPSYPVTGKAKPADSWRCKECHGWDYMGTKGAYGSGSHYTGIIGINAANVKSLETIVEILKDNTHQYDNVLPATAINEIAMFVVEGQIDMHEIINYDNKLVLGDQYSGKKLYIDNCSDCHGLDGKDFNFSKDAEEYIGTIASANPWEALHKIRNGHPGAYIDHMTGRHTNRRGMGTSFMTPMREKLTVEEQGDLLSYIQTLPKK